MHPLRLHSPFSDAAPAAAPGPGRAEAGPLRAWSSVGKGLAAFVVGILIGASTILVAEIVTLAPEAPGHSETGAGGTAPLDQGPLQLRR